MSKGFKLGIASALVSAPFGLAQAASFTAIGIPGHVVATLGRGVRVVGAYTEAGGDALVAADRGVRGSLGNRKLAAQRWATSKLGGEVASEVQPAHRGRKAVVLAVAKPARRKYHRRQAAAVTPAMSPA